MAGIESADYSDIKKAGSGFSFTGGLSNLAINDNWTDGYKSLVDENVKENGYTTMWKAVSSGSEDAGNDFYKKIRNYIDDIGNIDTCGLDALSNYANILGTKSDYLNINISFPIEIKNLVEIFSVNPAYLYNKATDGSQSTLVLSNSILHYSTVEQFLSALKDKDEYFELVNNVFYNTMMEFLNLKTTTFDDSVNGNVQTEIWKTDTNRFMNKLWGDDITSDTEIYALKEALGVSKSFMEKMYADDIIAGKKKLSDFSDIEQTILKAEIKSRETRYGDSNAMRYYYMRLFKVLEYFRFATIAYNNAYELEEYDLNANKYSILSNSDNRLSLLKFNYSDYEIDDTAVKKVSQWLTRLSFGIRTVREEMKSQCKRNMMVGTKRLIVDIIRRFILEKIDKDVLGDVRNSILYSAGLNKKFGVSVIEYSDMTEYFNIENPNDAVKPSKYGLHSRYWDMYDDSGNSFTNDDVLSFYNRLFGDSKKFVENSQNGSDSSDNLYEFLSILFEAGATSTTNSDYYLSSDLYVADGGSTVASYEKMALSEEDKKRVAKYSGDMYFADAPYVQHKNMFHPSYQLHPFIQAFEEYNEAYTSVMNLVNAYTEDINESYRRLDDRLDSLGNTINFWYNWNEDFSGYSTTYEKSGSDFDIKSSQEGPFNFKALQEFIRHQGEYINNILNGVNEFYYDSSTGKALLTMDEIRIEVARLQKYALQIKRLSEREIYKYGKDYNVNIYILYKDKGNRRERNALGDVWVRLRNHPIAFPLFDLSLSPVRFNETSCIKESDNSKLLSVLTKILSFFKKSYGKHYTDKNVQDGSVVADNLGLTINTYSETVPVTKSDGVSSYAFSYSGGLVPIDGNFRPVDISYTSLQSYVTREVENGKIYDVGSIESLSSFGSTHYFVDSVTNAVIGGGNASTYSVSSENPSGGIDFDSNPTGRILATTEEDFFEAEYDNIGNILSIRPNTTEDYGHDSDMVVFADYEDVNANDGRTYYCIDSISGKRHPCTRREIHLNRLYSIPYAALSGEVLSNGNVVFGGSMPTSSESAYGNNPFSNYSVTTTTEHTSSILDGGLVYKDFGKLKYVVTRGGLKVPVDSSEVVVIAGSNPYHIYRGEDGRIELEKAEVSEGYDTSDSIEFSDSIYRNSIEELETVSSFAFSACEFTTSYKEGYSDTIGQFYLRGRPYQRYQPFTALSGHPFRDSSSLSPDSPTGSITLYGEDGSSDTFYYALSTRLNHNYEECVDIKSVSYNRYLKTVNLTAAKLNGRFELTPYNPVEYPIYLDFSLPNCDNVAVYSSYLSEISQQKFFDMGFSYSQKLFYLSYTDGSDEYLDGGTIVGTLDENYDANYNTFLSFHRDSNHNVEFVDSRSSFLSGTDESMFHIGDASSKRGIFTAYGKYSAKDDGSGYLEVALTLFSTTDVAMKKFGVDIPNGLYDFAADENYDGGSRYSFNISCTESRLYVSFTVNPPDDTDTISNTLNGASAGSVGSAVFGNVKSSFMDCMVQVVSFDITDDEVEYMSDETRFVFGGGDIGFFQQFPGILGKNNIFTNTKLSSDAEFPIQPQFSALTGSSDIEFLHTYESEIQNFSSDRSVRYFSRFINIPEASYSSYDTVSGFLVEDGNDRAMYVMACSSTVGSSFEFGSIGGRKITDISRGIDSGVNVIADGLNEYNRCAAFVENGTAEHPLNITGSDVIKKELSLISVRSNVNGYSRFDFNDIVDSDDGFYSLHSDGKTVSVVSVSAEAGEFNPVSGICQYSFYPYGMVDALSSIPIDVKNGTLYLVGDEVYKNVDGNWICIERSNISPSDITAVGFQLPVINRDGYYESSSTGNVECFGMYNGGYATWFGAFGENVTVQIQKSPLSYGTTTHLPVAFSVSGSPIILYPNSIDSGSDRVDSYISYAAQTVVKNGEKYEIRNLETHYALPSYSLKFRSDELIESIVDTAYPSIKLINTSLGWIYRYDVESGTKTPSHTFEEIYSNSELDSFSDFHTVVSPTKNHIMVSYWSKGDNVNGVLRTRKNTPDSAAQTVKFVDSNGKSVEVGIITKFLSVGETVLAEESGGYRIFRSVDDGNTFALLDGGEDTLELVGCGTNRFYARYGNGEKVYSDDGVNWRNAENINASNWNVFNASGIDYLSCSAYDEDLKRGLLEKRKFVLIKEQMKFDNGGRIFEKLCVNGNGDIVCISGMDGKTLVIGRVFNTDGKYGNIEYIEYPYVNGMMFSDAHVVDEDVVLSPNGGMTALRIIGAFNKSSNTETKFIDISTALNNEINVFGGFGEANGRVLMYPSDGNSILVYDNANSKFHRLYSFDSVMSLSNCDSIGLNGRYNAILSPRSSSINGRVKFSVTQFDDRLDYGIVEIDEGFPILVTYVKLNTYFDSSSVHGDVYKIVFTFLNDQNGRAVSMLSAPFNLSSDGLFEFSDWNAVNEIGYAEGIYIVNGKSIKYGFHSSDSTPKFRIEKLFSDYSQNSANTGGLRIDVIAPTEEERENIGVTYGLSVGHGGLCVYGDINSENSDYKMELD